VWVIRNDDDIVFASDPEDGQGVSGSSVPFWEGAAPRNATYGGAHAGSMTGRVAGHARSLGFTLSKALLGNGKRHLIR